MECNLCKVAGVVDLLQKISRKVLAYNFPNIPLDLVHFFVNFQHRDFPKIFTTFTLFRRISKIKNWPEIGTMSEKIFKFYRYFFAVKKMEDTNYEWIF